MPSRLDPLVWLNLRMNIAPVPRLTCSERALFHLETTHFARSFHHFVDTRAGSFTLIHRNSHWFSARHRVHIQSGHHTQQRYDEVGQFELRTPAQISHPDLHPPTWNLGSFQQLDWFPPSQFSISFLCTLSRFQRPRKIYLSCKHIDPFYHLTFPPFFTLLMLIRFWQVSWYSITCFSSTFTRFSRTLNRFSWIRITFACVHLAPIRQWAGFQRVKVWDHGDHRPVRAGLSDHRWRSKTVAGQVKFEKKTGR